MNGLTGKILLSLAMLTMIGWMSAACASDSTEGGFFDTSNADQPVTSPTPPVKAGSPYLVDQGTAWIGAYDTTNHIYGGVDEGYLDPIECKPEVVSPPASPANAHEAYCVVRGLSRPFFTEYDSTNNQPDICPAGFKAKISIKSETSINKNITTTAFACALPHGLSSSVNVAAEDVGTPVYSGQTTGQFGNRFWIYAVVSAQSVTDTGGPKMYPGNGFSFEITCEPTNNPMLPYKIPNSECYKPIKRDKMPVLLETGVSSVTPNYQKKHAQTFDTTLICPQGNTPYMQMTIAAPDNYNANINNFELLNSFSYCIQKMAPSNTNNAYTVSYLFAASRTNISKSASTLTVNDPDRGAARGFINLQWRLYCYPPGLTPPVDYTSTTNGLDDNCNPNQAPYDQ